MDTGICMSQASHSLRVPFLPCTCGTWKRHDATIVLFSLCSLYQLLIIQGLCWSLPHSKRTSKNLWHRPEPNKSAKARTTISSNVEFEVMGSQVFGMQCTLSRWDLQSLCSCFLIPALQVRDSSNSNYVDFKLSSTIVLHVQAGWLLLMMLYCCQSCSH